MIDSIQGRFEQIQGRIRSAALQAGRDPSEVELIVVTKGTSPRDVASVIEAGATALGENRLQDALPRMDSPVVTEASADRAVRWHFIGHLQRNKARPVVERFDRIDSIDSLRLARMVSRQCAACGQTRPVLVQINASREASKHGFPIDDPDALVEAIEAMQGMDGMTIRGLMTIGPLSADTDTLRQSFAEMAELRSAMAARLPGTDLSTLSMGMSGDFELALEYGSTEVRIGRAIFSAPGV